MEFPQPPREQRKMTLQNNKHLKNFHAQTQSIMKKKRNKKTLSFHLKIECKLQCYITESKYTSMARTTLLWPLALATSRAVWQSSFMTNGLAEKFKNV